MKKLLIFIILSIIIKTNGQAENSVLSEWPAIPYISIITEDSIMPSYTIVNPPEGCVGISITNNNHVPGRMIMTLKGDTIYDSGEYVKGESGMRIKIRGNSTGAYLDQHPYKIKLSKKADLLMRGNKKYKHKDWALLSMYTWHPKLTNAESNTTTLFGLELARTVGMPWEPETEFVNVSINDKYQGLYYLIETVDKGESRINVDDTGFIIENDAYWWNENGVYFRTENQPSNLGYTYKYPDSDDVNDSIQETLKDYMNQVENQIWMGKDITTYIDYQSFATWILAHDILNTYDIYGSNMYLWKKDLDTNDVNSTLLKMGPLWDFDSSFRNEENSWTKYHTQNNSYYPELFKQKEFWDKYKEIYAAIRPSLLEHMRTYCNTFEEKYGTAFAESMQLHQNIYPGEGKNPLHSQLTELLGKLETRLNVLDQLIEKENTTNIENIQFNGVHNQAFKRTDILGRDYSHVEASSLPTGMYIEHLPDGSTKKYYKQ